MSMTTARRTLRGMWADAKVESCSDGTIKISPKWRKQWRNPGFITRSYSAHLVAETLNIKREK